MPKLRVHDFSMSVDGYFAGPDQSVDNPLGGRGEELHTWAFDDVTPLDRAVREAGNEGIGATIMGRNMFGPVRGEWGDEDWKGWWGDDPPFHHPVFVLTHYVQEPIPMEGGTVFFFVDGGIEDALEQAFAAADGQDVRLGGGAAAVRQYLRAGLVDYLHIPIAPVLLGSGERLFEDLDGAMDAYAVVKVESSPAVTHVHIEKR